MFRFMTHSKISPEEPEPEPEPETITRRERAPIEISPSRVVELFDEVVEILGDDWERINDFGGIAFKLKTKMSKEQSKELDSNIKNCLNGSGFRVDFMKAGGIGTVCQFNKNYETKIIF